MTAYDGSQAWYLTGDGGLNDWKNVLAFNLVSLRNDGVNRKKRPYNSF